MASLQTLTGNAGLLAANKGSERTGSVPGAENGGTNLSSAFAAAQPRTAAEMDVHTAAANAAVSSWRPVTGQSQLDELRAFRAATVPAPSVLGDTSEVRSNFNLGDLDKKITEGANSLGQKFTSFDIGKKFDKVTSGAKEFLFGKSPEQIEKDTPAVAAWKKQQLDQAAAGKPSAASVNATIGQSTADDTSHFVTLTDAEGYILTFYVMPEIVEQRNVEYEAVAPPQFPGAFQKYKGTSSVQWTVNATFVCRTADEATRNLEFLNRLRGWTMPFFGNKTQGDVRFKDKIGAPPPVLMFKGFRESIIGEVPVVITSLSWNWPKDVDYIPARKLQDNYESFGAGGADTGVNATIPFPTIIQVAIQLVESFSTEQFNKLNIGEYRVGHMKNAFSDELYVFKADQSGSPPTREEAQQPPPGSSPSLSAGGARLASAAGQLSGAARLGASIRAGVDSRVASITEAIQSSTANIQKRVRTYFSPPNATDPANTPGVPNDRGDF